MFLALEGIEGSGKTTLALNLAEYFGNRGRKVLCSREPGGTDIGKKIRSLMLSQESSITDNAELFLFLADRAQHVAEIIRPALADGKIVICDRYSYSTLAYQGAGRGLDKEILRRACNLATDNLWPDITLILDLDVNIGLERARRRQEKSGAMLSEGRFEAETLIFHEAVRKFFLELAKEEPDCFIIIDATQCPQKMLKAAIKGLKERNFL